MSKKTKTKININLVLIGVLLFSLLLIVFLIQSFNDRAQADTIFGALDSNTPYGQSGPWSLVFNDEFDSNTINTSKWVNGYYYGTQDDDMGNASMSNSTDDGQYLHLKASGSNSSFTVGALTTKQIFQTGYFEARMKLAKGMGSWPAFWALSEVSGNHREVDFMEYLGNFPNSYYATIHKQGPQVGQKKYSGNVDLSADFHIYAGEITPTYVAIFFDGVEIWRTNRTDFQAPYKLMVNQGIMCNGDLWDNNKCDATTFAVPKDTMVDWVRVWNRAGSPAPTSTATSTPVASTTPRPTMTASPTPRPTAVGTPVPTKTPNSSPTPTPQTTMDTVTIQQARVWRFWRFARLHVVATSSQKPEATLFVKGYGRLRYSRYNDVYSGFFYMGRRVPTEITVKSSLGGVATSEVTTGSFR